MFGSSGASLHTKALSIDQKTLFVGSYNLDPRSTWLNCEQGVLVESPVLTAQFRSIFEAQTAGSPRLARHAARRASCAGPTTRASRARSRKRRLRSACRPGSRASCASTRSSELVPGARGTKVSFRVRFAWPDIHVTPPESS